jgi:Glycosyl hydrolases family 25
MKPGILAMSFLLLAFLITGCGRTHPSAHPVVPLESAPPKTPLLRGPAACSPALGHGVMGACSKPNPTLAAPEIKRQGAIRGLSHGCSVPDVSEYQPNVNWNIAKHHICGAILRVADGTYRDKVFQRYLKELRKLHIWHGIYIYVRPWSNCAAEADWALSLIPGGLDSGPLIADDETALPYGCQRAFSREVERKSGWHVAVDYSSSGTWPGGPVDPHTQEWDAAYGSSPGCFLCRGHRRAWQHTDGLIGAFPHALPGIGSSDISRDEGIIRLVRHPGPSCDRICRLRRLYELRSELRRDLTRRRCRVIHGKRAYPLCPRWGHEGHLVNRRIRMLGGR